MELPRAGAWRRNNFLLTEGCKGLLYMVLHARVVLDLCEQLEQEISFEQVEGDFDSLSGKWHFEQLGSHHTLLKYSVESRMHKDTFLSEALMEEVVYEDLPSNLCAIRDSIEKRGLKNSFEVLYQGNLEEKSVPRQCNQSNGYMTTVEGVSAINGRASFRPRPKVPGLQRDIEVLKAEVLKFISEHGQEGFMPMRKQLRMHGRVDIEKAITRMGGFRRIASLMNLSLAYKHRKPKGYWDKFDNLQEEEVHKLPMIEENLSSMAKSIERLGIQVEKQQQQQLLLKYIQGMGRRN
ncbi:Polyketide_cyc domain-containing protein [Cucumis melo var. makuwa]|uniref:Polyketide_cyc domain-containing protein n=1 Tax=Cucumis melo var. makuwa TaxID=1194695 RepID=A0A5D3BRX9_CUCMM|nr:Polyketide_cyc domain-containing protein [Cucumis melo var. makuwa]